MTIDSKEIARRLADADGMPLVTLDAVVVKEARAYNEVLFDKVRQEKADPTRLFVTSPPGHRASARIGAGLRGEWWTRIRLTGDGVRIGRDVNILGHGGVEIGAGARIGDGVNIDTIGHPNNPVQRNTAHVSGPVVIGRNVAIGSGAVLIPRRGRPLIVGDGARIANGAVVKTDVPAGATVAGVLAKPTDRPVPCDMRRPERSREGFEVVADERRAKGIFGPGADVKFPIYVRGAHHVAVEGDGRVGINFRATFDLAGPLTMVAPYKMATDATIVVGGGGSLSIGREAFLYMNAAVVARGPMRIGDNAILAAGASADRDVAAGDIVGGPNRVLGKVDGDPVDPCVRPDWNDPGSLAPKVAEFKRYKAPLGDLPLDRIGERAIAADRALLAFRTRPYPKESVLAAGR